MTFSPGSLIEAVDLQGIVGPLSSTQAYPDLPSTNLCLGALWGVGHGTVGLGQGSPKLLLPSAGQNVQSADWTALRTALSRMAAHQGSTVTLPSSGSLAPGATVSATGVDWATPLSVVQANLANADTLTFASVDLNSSSRTNDWTSTLSYEVSCYFGTEDAARYFYNALSELRVSAGITSPTTAPAIEWSATLSAMGSIGLGSTATTQTGTGGTPAAIGFWTLTSSYQTIFTQNLAAPYATDSVTLEARAGNVAGVNGGNGSRVDLRLRFNLVSASTVDGTLVATVSAWAADGTLISVPLPLVINNSLLDETTPPSLYSWTDTVAGVETNYDVAAAATADGWDGVQPLFGHLIVANTGSIVSSTTSAPAILASTLPPLSRLLITVEPQAVIAGRGGEGGVGAPSSFCGCLPGGAGQSGGPAVFLQTGAMVHNFGVIGGGGGGGGGGGAECSVGWRASAGGGGGGAGFGLGGVSNPCGVTEGRVGGLGAAGTLIQGGAGGSAGNPFTARGGRGGDLGLPGSPGQTITGLGGVGGSGGVSLSESFYLEPGSVLGDTRGFVV
jgi:hypothetical protein